MTPFSKVQLTLLVVLCTGGTPRALAHGPAPAPLAVVSTSAESTIPDLVRTNIGLALSLEDGSYAYGCPSQWGDIETAFVASTPGREIIAMVGGGALYLSTNQGCTFQTRQFPLEDGQVRNVVAWGEQIYGIAALEDGGVVFKVNASLEVQIDRELDERPDTAFVSSNDEGESFLIVAGAKPTAFVWAAREDSDGSLAWTQIGTNTDFGTVDFMGALGVGADGSAWVRVSKEGQRSLYRADFAEEDLLWEESGDGFSFVLGPAWTGASWIAVLDGQVAQWTGESWLMGEDVNWTCLQSFQGVAYACTLQQLFVVSEEVEIDNPLPSLSPVFHMNQFGPPLEGCPIDYEEGIACQTDWLHYGGESGLVGKSPALTPDGLRPPDPEKGPPGSSAGCVAHDTPVNPSFLALILMLGILSRADRRLRRGDR